MTTRISVTPDKNGRIHITCDGADLELDIGGGSGGPAPSAGPLPPDPGSVPILSLVGPSWKMPDDVTPPPVGHPLMIRADVIDFHALHAIAGELPDEGREPGVALVHVDLRR
jgi:hypothetical protein